MQHYKAVPGTVISLKRLPTLCKKIKGPFKKKIKSYDRECGEQMKMNLRECSTSSTSRRSTHAMQSSFNNFEACGPPYVKLKKKQHETLRKKERIKNRVSEKLPKKLEQGKVHFEI